MSVTIVDPVARQTTRDSDMLFHFACSLHRAAAVRAGIAVRCLCGVTQLRSSTTGSGQPPAAQRCVVCADLAPAHLAVCSTCRRAVAS